MARRDKPTYAPLPARAIGDQKLTALDLRVLAALAAHDRLGANGIGCYASHPRLAALVGCHEKSLSRSLAVLAGGDGGQQYIEAGRHPLNARLRVYRVRYTEFDKQFLGQSIGNDPATSRRKRKGNGLATIGGTIGNRRAPAQVTGNGSIGNRPNPFSVENQYDDSANILNTSRETEIHPAEAGKTSRETAPEIGADVNLGQQKRATRTAPEGEQGANIGEYLARLDHAIQRGHHFSQEELAEHYVHLRAIEESRDGPATERIAGWVYRLQETLAGMMDEETWWEADRRSKEA